MAVQINLNLSDEKILEILRQRLGVRNSYFLCDGVVCECDCWGDPVRVPGDINPDAVKIYQAIRQFMGYVI